MREIFRLLRYVKGFWKETVITWISVFVECIAEVLVAFFMQFLINEIKNLETMPDRMNNIVLLSCLIAGMAILAAVTGIIAGVFAATAAAGFGKNVREAIFTHIQDYSFKNIDKFSTSSLITRITTDVTNVQSGFQMIIRMVVRAPLIMVFALIMCFVTYWQAAIIFLAIIPVVFVALILIANKAHPIFVKVFESYDDLNEVVSQDVDGIRVVKSFNQEALQKEKFGGVSGFIYRNFKKAEHRVALNGPVLNLSIYGATIAVCAIIANAIIGDTTGALDVGTLSTTITYVMMIMMSLLMVSAVYVTLIIGKNSTIRICEALEEEPDIKNPKNPIFDIENGDVEFKNVSFGYHKNKEVLLDINQKVASGKTVGILGSTGSSKTTLVSLIARLFDVTEGEILVGDHNVKEYDLKALRDSVAVVLQKNTLFSGTIKENIKWGNKDATDEEIEKVCDIAQVSPFLKDLPNGLETKLDEGGTNVSGGQKQRICIARALLKNPKILILDDSTSACDTHTDALIREGLDKYRPGVTKFIIAQRVLSVMGCDEIWVMNEGRILETGNHASLIQSSVVYKELFDSQNGGGDFDAAN